MACGFYATLHGSIGIFIFPRAGNVDVSASPVVTYACVLFSIAHKAAGAADHPAFPAPSRVEDVVLQKLGQACRGNARSCPLGCLKFESENTRSSRTSELLAARSAVKWRARSGTHNHGPLLYEDRPTPLRATEKFRGMGPGLRRDNSGRQKRYPAIWAKLFRGRCEPAVLELRFEPGLLGARLPDDLVLDVTVAPDHFGNARKFCEQRDLRRRERRDALLDHRKIVVDQPALGAAFFRAPKRIKGRAAQEFKLRQQAERVDHPAAIFLLLQAAGFVALCKDRRRQIEFEAVVALEPVRQFSGKAAVGIEPRDFVLVLVGHQLEQVFRNCLGEFGRSRRSRSFRLSTLATAAR